MLYWHQNYCPNAQYLIKTDDDIYFHIPNVIKWLKTIGNVSGNHSNSNHNRNNTIFCHRNISRKILRNANIKDLFLYSSFGRQNNDKQLIERSRKKFQKYIVEYKQLPGKKVFISNQKLIYIKINVFCKQVIYTRNIVPVLHMQ